MEHFGIAFAPHVPLNVLTGFAVAAALILGVSIWRGARGAIARAVAFTIIIGALANPLIVREMREGLNDVVALVIDRSQSQDIGERRAQSERALTAMRDDLKKMPGIEVHEAEVRTDADVGTALFNGVEGILGQVPPDRLAATIVITDGEVHDAPATKDFKPGAPFHVLLTGAPGERDRKLTVVQASRYSIVGKDAQITVKVEDFGQSSGGTATLTTRIDGVAHGTQPVPIGKETTIKVPVAHGGENLVELEVSPGNAEQTLQNNRAVVPINGIRDRLRVLLVSGQPHAGELVWRNLLKADPSVDLIHFTILRPPEKIDNTPTEELSLITFPYKELFVDKLKEFDLVILDRYVNDDQVIPLTYLDNIARYVENGGALLIASGPEFAAKDTSIFNTPLAPVLPAQPSGMVTTQGFKPVVTAQGQAHPVTSGLVGSNPDPSVGAKAPSWGRWFRVINSQRLSGTVVMEGANNQPLLVLDHHGNGRVAELLSDQAWLWARGFEGGGPQAELLRRLAHWLMKEPDLEEEKLTAEVADGNLNVSRRTMADHTAPVKIISPSGKVISVDLTKGSPGLFAAHTKADELGLYRLSDGTLNAIAASGPLNPREVADMRATDSILKPFADATGGGVKWIRDGIPELRAVAHGATSYGSNWLGIQRRGAFRVTSVDEKPLLPPWLALILLIGTVLIAWRLESR